jgi:transcriptional regulator GlxA family with amidase domain
MLLIPGQYYTARTEPGPVLALQVDPDLLREELHARGRTRASFRALQCTSAGLSPAARIAFNGLHEEFMAAAKSASGDRESERVQTLERSVGAWVANRLLENSGLKASSPAALQLATDMDTWIRRHLAERITLERLRAVSGVSTRALQYACVARWGRTPIELLAERRLENARSLLTARPLATSVTHAAVNSGFSHLGRFSGLYKRTFGESPSDTIARS